jgi:hypothetical protein
MSENQEDATSIGEEVLERVIGKWINYHSSRVNLRLAVLLFGRQAVKNARRKAEQKQNVPPLTIQSVLGDPLGYVRVNGTLFEGLKRVAWNDGVKPPEFFNLYGMTPEGDYYLLPYTKPISELPSEVFLMGVRNKYDSKEEMLNVVSKYGLNLENASETLREDREVVLAAVTHEGEAIQFAAHPLLEDRDIVFAALTQRGDLLDYAEDPVFLNAAYQLLKDRDFVFAAVTQCGDLLEVASVELKNDRDIVLAAVKQSGIALADASKALRNDKDVVLATVSHYGFGLAYASEALRNDKDVVLRAVTQDGRALNFASKALRNDSEIKAVAGI